MHVSETIVFFEHAKTCTAAQLTAELRSSLIFTLGHSSPRAHKTNTRLTCNRRDAGGQVLLKGMLVRLRLLRLRQDMVTSVRKVGDLDLLSMRCLQLLQTFRVPTFL